MLKNLFTFIILFTHLLTLGNSQYSKILTQQEVEYHEWFAKTKTEFNWGFKNLSQEDKDIFKQGTNYNKDPKAISRVMRNFVNGFYKHAADNNIQVKYNAETINPILIKMQDYIAARMYVFSQLLTAQERLTIQQNNYLKNPQAALTVMTKSGKLLAEELARLNLIPNTVEDKNKAAQEFTQNKMAELKAAYGK